MKQNILLDFIIKRTFLKVGMCDSMKVDDCYIIKLYVTFYFIYIKKPTNK